MSKLFFEDIEKHDTLNQKLFGSDDKLKPEIVSKIKEIVNTFIENLTEDNIKIVVKDIILIGSNVSYNYTKDSDLDIHIIADTKQLDCPTELYSALYSAYRSLFNKNFEIDFYGIPVEIFVETEQTNTVSNGVYSVLKNEWIKHPIQQDIPEIDRPKFDAEFASWEDRYNKIYKLAKDVGLIEDTVTEDLTGYETALETKIESFIEDIYQLRKVSIPIGGEYSTGNLIFKEVRNRGYLDLLKQLKNKLKAKQLSLHDQEKDQLELNEDTNFQFTSEMLYNYKKIIAMLTSRPVMTSMRGTGEPIFIIKNIKQLHINLLVDQLRSLAFVKRVEVKTNGKITKDFAPVYGELNNKTFDITIYVKP